MEATSVGRGFTPSWHEHPGMEGMREVLDRVFDLAKSIDPRVTLAEPELVVLYCDETRRDYPRVLTRLLIPRDLDTRSFRDEFNDRLTDMIAPEDGMRLAIGVGHDE